MSWKRGKGTVEVELANLQSYVENIDPDLRGDGNDPGVIAIVRENEAKKKQRDKDNRWMLALIGMIPILIEVLRGARVIP